VRSIAFYGDEEYVAKHGTTGLPSIPANLTANEPQALTHCSLIKLSRDRVPVSR
jgi:hypothetical protein